MSTPVPPFTSPVVPQAPNVDPANVAAPVVVVDTHVADSIVNNDLAKLESFLHALVASKLESQPWYKKYANTVVAVISGIINLVYWVSTLGFDLPHPVVVGIGAILAAGSMLGIKATKNGFTDSLKTGLLSEAEKYISPRI